ncbi:MAG: hypothetical protein IT365_23440 [Candidatus Hydrogenedentes bacterium]|nr:hypothetical protein [Candidatus Hydrogenedentota bacterium]
MNPERLIVVVLADHLYSANRIWQGIRDIPNVDVVLFVCNNRWNAVKFLAANAYGCLIKMGVTSTIRLLSDLFTRRVRARLHFSKLSDNLDQLRSLSPDVGLHAMSVIYRQNAIDCFRLGILNPHIGKLPEFRGRSVMEWSLLYGAPTGVTAFFIDAGIDTGKDILFFREFPVDNFATIDDAKNYLFAQNVWCFREALSRLADLSITYQRNDTDKGRRFYVMSDLLKEVVTEILTGDVQNPRG